MTASSDDVKLNLFHKIMGMLYYSSPGMIFNNTFYFRESQKAQGKFQVIAHINK